jgi:hypothetical protein
MGMSFGHNSLNPHYFSIASIDVVRVAKDRRAGEMALKRLQIEASMDADFRRRSTSDR